MTELKIIPRKISRTSTVFVGLVVAIMLVACSPVLHQQGTDDTEMQYIYGRLREVSPQQDSLVIQSGSGFSLPLDLDAQSKRIGFSSQDKLIPGDVFKVWYLTEGGAHRILKIEKVPFLGC